MVDFFEGGGGGGGRIGCRPLTDYAGVRVRCQHADVCHCYVVEQDTDQAAAAAPSMAGCWEKHTAPHPENSDFEVTYYHNRATGENTYKRPAAFPDNASDASDVYPPRQWAQAEGNAGERQQLHTIRSGGSTQGWGRGSGGPPGSNAPNPPDGWEKHSAPHPENSDFEVTYYHNPATGQNTYKRPATFPDNNSDASDVYPPRQWSQTAGPGDAVERQQLPMIQSMGSTEGWGRGSAAQPQTAATSATGGWEKHSAPHPENSAFEVVFYHNAATGQSTYSKPSAFVDDDESDLSDIYPPLSWTGAP